MSYPYTTGEAILADGINHDLQGPQEAFVNAGEAIGAFKAVYIDATDSEWKLCDGNDADKLDFAGFSLEAGTDGNKMKVRTDGVVGGFSGLTTGSKYYLSDTAGEIQSTPGTYEVLVGIAVSPTKLLISKKYSRKSGIYYGSEAFSDSIAGSTVGDLSDTVTLPSPCYEAVIQALVSIGTNNYNFQMIVRRGGITIAKWGASDVSSLTWYLQAQLSVNTITITSVGINTTPARSMTGNAYYYF